jgi:hypothetical protein
VLTRPAMCRDDDDDAQSIYFNSATDVVSSVSIKESTGIELERTCIGQSDEQARKWIAVCTQVNWQAGRRDRASQNKADRHRGQGRESD